MINMPRTVSSFVAEAVFLTVWQKMLKMQLIFHLKYIMLHNLMKMYLLLEILRKLIIIRFFNLFLIFLWFNISAKQSQNPTG